MRFFLVIAAALAIATTTRADTSAVGAYAAVSQESNAENIPLRPRGPEHPGTATGIGHSPSTGQTLTTAIGGLAVCLGIFFLFVWFSKRSAPAGLAPLPKEVVESLGRATLSGRQQLQLLRVGRKLVLLHVTPASTEALTEIVDPAEVDRLVGLCQQASPNSVTASFRDVLTTYESEPAAKGFLGAAGQSDWELATRGNSKRSSRREEIDG